MRAYCVKCRDQKEIDDAKTTKIINKRDIPMLQGPCPDCNKVCNTFLKREGGVPKPPKPPGEKTPKREKPKKKRKLKEEIKEEIKDLSFTRPQEEDSQSTPAPPPVSTPEG